jgi:hypothetical protein
MKDLNWLGGMAFIFAIIFIAYGWTQSWDFSCRTGECETILIKRTVSTYAFIIGGIILLSIGIVIVTVKKHLLLLKELVYEFNRK